MVRRRLEFPDEFILADGSRLETPGELAERLAGDSATAREILERVAAGEVELWLSRSGWGPYGQRIAALRRAKKPLEARAVAAALLGEPARESPAATEPDGDTGGSSVGESSAASSETPTGGTEGTAADLPPPSASAGPRINDDLLARQREAVRAFLGLEQTRQRGEETAAAQIRSQEAAVRGEAESELATAEGLVTEARQRARQAFERLEEAGVPAVAEMVTPDQPGRGLELEARGVGGLAAHIGSRLNELSQLREQLDTRRSLLIRVGAIVAVSLLLIAISMWTANRSDRRAAAAVPVQMATPEPITAPQAQTPTPSAGPASAPPRDVTPAPTTRSTGTLVIRTNVYEDTVVLDGRVLGPSPQTLEVSAGEHTVEARKKDCTPARRRVTIARAQRQVVRLKLVCVTPQDVVERAQGLFEAGEYDQALAVVDEALELDPAFQPAHELRRRIEATRAILRGDTDGR